MRHRPCDTAATPRNYPISLLQSARAVFGADYDGAERDAERPRDMSPGQTVAGTIRSQP